MRRLALVLALAACEQPRTEIMIGVVTDIRAPNVIDGAQLVVTRSDDGFLLQQVGWDISGAVGEPENLPGSYGVYNADGEEVRLQIELTGLKGATEVVKRTAVLNLVNGKTLFFRIGLTAGCAAVGDCGPSQSCVEGVCVDRAVDARRLPDFEEQLVAELTCQSGASYIDTATGDPMPLSEDASACPSDLCFEGTCIKPEPSDGTVVPADDAGVVVPPDRPDGGNGETGDGGSKNPVDDEISHWPLDGNAIDIGPAGQSGVLDGVMFGFDRDGLPNRAAVADVLADSIQIPMMQPPGPVFTVSLWAFYGVQPAVADPDGVRLISNETGGAFNGLFAISMPGGTQLQILTRDGVTFRRVVIPAPSQGAWHHLAAVVDGPKVALFVDGVPMMEGTQAGFADSTPRAWNIGGTPSSNALGFVGSIDEVKLFRRPLMPSEIQTLAND